MAILADKNTRLLVQGITGREGSFHTKQMHLSQTTSIEIPVRSDQPYLKLLSKNSTSAAFSSVVFVLEVQFLLGH